MGGGRWALLSAASWVSGVSAAVQTGVACTPSSNTLKLQWNPYASEWGAYEVEGCTGVNPKLQLTAGVTYTFDQSHESNWRAATHTRRGSPCLIALALPVCCLPKH